MYSWVPWISLCRRGWPCIHRDLSASDSRVLGLQVCHTTPVDFHSLVRCMKCLMTEPLWWAQQLAVLCYPDSTKSKRQRGAEEAHVCKSPLATSLSYTTPVSNPAKQTNVNKQIKSQISKKNLIFAKIARNKRICVPRHSFFIFKIHNMKNKKSLLKANFFGTSDIIMA